MTSCPRERSKFTSFVPIKPVPPRTTIFIFLFLVSGVLSFIMTASSSRHGCLPKRFSVAERFEPVCFNPAILWLELFKPMARCFKVVIS